MHDVYAPLPVLTDQQKPLVRHLLKTKGTHSPKVRPARHWHNICDEFPLCDYVKAYINDLTL